MKLEYKLVVGEGPSCNPSDNRLEFKVQNLLDEEWELHGDTKMVVTKDGFLIFSQAMVRSVEDTQSESSTMGFIHSTV